MKIDYQNQIIDIKLKFQSDYDEVVKLRDDLYVVPMPCFDNCSYYNAAGEMFVGRLKISYWAYRYTIVKKEGDKYIIIKDQHDLEKLDIYRWDRYYVDILTNRVI